MRRLARHLFTLCSAASLLLCVAVCALWVRSYWVGESLGRLHERGQWRVDVSRGIFSGYHERIVDPISSYNSYTEDGSDPFELRRVGSGTIWPDLAVVEVERC
jgi:hypothetical protein